MATIVLKKVTSSDVAKTSDAGQSYRCQHCGAVYDTEEERSACYAQHIARVEWVADTKAEPCDPSSTRTEMTECTIPGPHRTVQMWSDEATKHLILLIKENYSRLTGSEKKKANFWKEIRSKLLENVPNASFTAKQCQVKWMNIRSHFRKYEDRKNFTTSRIRRPPFYDILCSFLGQELDSGRHYARSSGYYPNYSPGHDIVDEGHFGSSDSEAEANHYPSRLSASVHQIGYNPGRKKLKPKSLSSRLAQHLKLLTEAVHMNSEILQEQNEMVLKQQQDEAKRMTEIMDIFKMRNKILNQLLKKPENE